MPLFSPAFILTRPQMGENIGAAARVMKNFGFADLRIVAPRDGWPNEKAQSMAAGGADVIASAKLYETLRDAVADLHYTYATSARPRDMEKLSISSHEFVSHVQGGKQTQHVGIIFGPERTGLENAELALADCITYVPINPVYPSLNLAQTVALMAYECSKLNLPNYSQGHHPEHQNAPQRNTQALASKQELHGMFDHLETELDARNFWKVAHKKPQMWINIRNLFTRAAPTEQEVRTLRGIIRSLSER